MRRIGVSGPALVAILLCQIPATVNADSAPLTADALLDRVKIEDMMVDYYNILSSDDHELLGQYFTEDAELDVDRNIFKGRDAIEKLYNDVRDPNLPRGTRNSTLLNNPRISIHGDTAEMDALYTVIISDRLTAPPRLIEHGADHAEFIKKDGRWLITKRVVVTYNGG